MKAAIVCQDVYEYNMQEITSQHTSMTGREIKNVCAQPDLLSKKAEKTYKNMKTPGDTHARNLYISLGQNRNVNFHSPGIDK